MAVYRRSLTPDGTLVVIGGKARSLIAVGLASLSRKPEGQDLGLLIWSPVPEQISEMLELCASGAIKVAIDRVFPLEKAGEALRRVGDGKSLGKVVVRVADAA